MTETLERVKTYQQLINGEFVDAASGETLDVDTSDTEVRARYEGVWTMVSNKPAESPTTQASRRESLRRRSALHMRLSPFWSSVTVTRIDSETWGTS